MLRLHKVNKLVGDCYASVNENTEIRLILYEGFKSETETAETGEYQKIAFFFTFTV